MDNKKFCKVCGRPINESNAKCTFCLPELRNTVLIKARPKKKLRIVEALLCLTFPYWGTTLFVALHCHYKSDLFLYLGAFFFLISACPIFLSKSIGIILKILCSLIYYAYSAFMMFFVGWASICFFCPACN